MGRRGNLVLFCFARTFIAVLLSPAAEFPRTIEKAAERREGFTSNICQPHFHLFGESAAKKTFFGSLRTTPPALRATDGGLPARPR